MAAPRRSGAIATASSRRPRVVRRWRLALAALAIVAPLAGGCADYQPMPFPETREYPTFPGLLTGESGAWVIYRSEE